jgi:dsRNA-specific ribonuclease
MQNIIQQTLQPNEIYYGPRNEDFIKFIKSILKLGNIKDKYLDELLTTTNINIYSNAFTSEEVDIKNNYEVLEQLGDVCINNFMVFYIYRKYPQLDCSKGVQIVSKLKANLVSRSNFSDLADKLGFWDYITASIDNRKQNKKDILEDTFEAFIGATVKILDDKFIIGVGYSIIYDILKNIFDKYIKISLKYEDINDAKTLLKETFDYFKKPDNSTININKDINIIWISTHDNKQYIDNIKNNSNLNFNTYFSDWFFFTEKEKNINDEFYTTITKAVAVKTGSTVNKSGKNKTINGFYTILGEGKASRQQDSEQNASIMALLNLEQKYGFKKPIPEIYKEFCI